MYYTSAQLQYRPAGRMVIRCFGCGGPHKKVDCPNRMTYGTFIPLCGDCGPGHPIYECPLRVCTQPTQAPATPVNMIGTIYHPSIVPINAITRARAQGQGRAPEEVTKPKESNDPKIDKVIPLDYPNTEVELERLKALQEWIDEERIRFESKRVGRKPISISQEGNVVETPQAIGPNREPAQPMILGEVLNNQVQISLSSLLTHI